MYKWYLKMNEYVLPYQKSAKINISEKGLYYANYWLKISDFTLLLYAHLLILFYQNSISKIGF